MEKDWTQGSIVKNLLSLSWPMVVTNTLMMLGPTIDMIWVGKLGSTAVAAVGVSGMAVMMLNSMMMGLAQGMRAVIARFIGTQDLDGANNSAQQAFALCLGFSVVMALIGIFFSEPILRMLGLEEDVIVEGTPYMQILFVGSIAMSFRMLIESIMQASGDTVTPMKVTIVFRIVHVALCPVLVFGLWIFPEMGVRGAALTNVISQSIGTAIGMWFLMTGRTRLKLSFHGFSPDFSMIWRIVRIGLPALVSGLQRNASQLILMSFVTSFGTVAVAAHSLNQRIEMILFMPCFAIGMAAGVLAGQNLGAKQPERAETGAWRAVLMVAIMMGAFSLLLFFGGQYVVRIFSSETELVETAAVFLKIGVAGYLFLPLAAVFMNTLQGAGDTVPPMIISMTAVFIITLPLAYFLPRITDLGVLGIRWAMAIEMIAQAVVLTVYFRTGKWKTRRV